MFSLEFLEEQAKKRNIVSGEKDVFIQKILEKSSEQEIADKLHISMHSVRYRLTKVYEKFGILGNGPGKSARLLELLIKEFEKAEKYKVSKDIINNDAPQKLDPIDNAKLSNDDTIVVQKFVSTSTETKNKSFILAQQMRDWLETLKYGFEKNYEVQQDTYFEWIVNIQHKWRDCYDRVLIRGIAGEAGISDLSFLRQSVERQRTDFGWLVADRRISRAAREEIKKKENRHLECFTFDELLDQDADFSGYLDWLEQEVKRRKIDTKYVPLACIKEEIDPIAKRQIAVSHYNEQDGWIDGYIDRWLHDPAKEHISILGEFGTGKTWFVLHYAWVSLQRYRDAKKRGIERPRLPLVIPLRDYTKVITIEALFSEFFFRQYKVNLPYYDAFIRLNRMGKLLLIFDGFDEMALKVDRMTMINNFWELAKVVVPGAKVILTCRTEHFPEAKEGRALLNAELQVSTANLTGETPQFEVLELQKFNDDQIRQVLLMETESATVEIVMNNPELLDLARRPVMTELILEALPDIELGKPVDISRIYMYAVRRKMERDIHAKRTFTSLADKLYFLCELSWEMLSTNQMSLNYRVFPARIRHLFGLIVQEEKDLDHWYYDMMGQTILTRNSDGDYTPAHRSFLEFFVAYKFAAELGLLAEDFTELAQEQSNLEKNANPQEYTWSGYFYRQWDAISGINAIAPLSKFRSEPLEQMERSFGRLPLSKALIDLLLPMIHSQVLQTETLETGNRLIACETVKNTLLEFIEKTREKTKDEINYLGGNATALLLRMDKRALEGKDLNNTVIKGVDFTNVSLRGVNLTNTDLTDCIFNPVLGNIWSVAFSQVSYNKFDNYFLAVGDSTGRVSVRNAKTHKEIWSFKKHLGEVGSVVFSPNPENALLASGSDDKKIIIWNPATGEVEHDWQGNDNFVLSLAFSLPNGRFLAASGSDKKIRLWDLHDIGEHQEPKLKRVWEGHEGFVWPIALSSNLNLNSHDEDFEIASASEDGTIKIWNLETTNPKQTLNEDNGRVASITFRPGTRSLFSGHSDGTVRSWDLINRSSKVLYKHSGMVRWLAFSQNQPYLASGSDDKTIIIWDVDQKKQIHSLKGHTGSVLSIDFHPTEPTLVSGGDDSSIKFWDIKTGQCSNTQTGNNSGVYALTFDNKTDCLYICIGDGSLKSCELKKNNDLWKVILEGEDTVCAAAFEPINKNKIVTGRYSGSVKIINFDGQKKDLMPHEDLVWSVALTPDGSMVATAGYDKKIHIHNLCTEEKFTLKDSQGDVVWSIAFSSNEQLASGGTDKLVRIWNLGDKSFRKLEGHNELVSSVAFSSNGQILASGSYDRTVKLWNVATGDQISQISTEQQLRIIALSNNSHFLAAASTDGKIQIWNIKDPYSPFLEIELTEHDNSVLSLVFKIDEDNTVYDILASGDVDGTIIIWQIPIEKPTETKSIKTLRDRLYEGLNITGVIGLNNQQKYNLKTLGSIEK
jgi:predicted NACHT family NTPase